MTAQSSCGRVPFAAVHLYFLSFISPSPPLTPLARARSQDLSKQHGGAPKRAAAAEPHRSGVWSLHALRRSHDVWTASKDGTVRLSALTPADIVPGRTFAGHHRGVIRAVRARDAATAADAGADGAICLLDARAPASCVLTLADAHGGAAVSALEWSPRCAHVLLSAGSDPAARLWDVRSAGAPLATLAGHVAPHLQALRGVYRPTFVAHGAAVATGGEGSRRLSLYCAASGRARSRGALGFDPTVAFAGGAGAHDDRAPLLLARGGALLAYAPRWDACSGDDTTAV
jgi:WD40 repeat protein